MVACCAAGMVHQAVSTADHHSLHLTISTYQLFDWGQLFSKVAPHPLRSFPPGPNGRG